MDQRMNRWAKTLVGYCLEVQPGEAVAIHATPAAEPLITEVSREILRAGGHPVPIITLPGVREALLRDGNEEQLGWIDPATRAVVEHVKVRLNIMSETNTRQFTGIDPKRQGIVNRSYRELSKTLGSPEQRWCLTLYPTQGYAQEAGMSLAEFEEFVYEACFLNSRDPAERWRELGRKQQAYVDWLRDKREAHVIGPETDLRLSIAKRIFRNSDGKRNFPSGEFFTGPIEDSVEGHVRFTIPSLINGNHVQDIRLRFEHGRVVEASAAQGDSYLQTMLDLDEGARTLGEFAFGNNFGIQRSIGNTLFDEKIGGTIHMALGNSYPETGGKNVSALHWDMICDLRKAAGGGEVRIDGVTLLKDGKLMAL
ncbi:MAG TPA: aminopeptidase [Ktedonobacterales bacterium]|nr:aminopeptidase [Ktedonobacterales bacterium]